MLKKTLTKHLNFSKLRFLPLLFLFFTSVSFSQAPATDTRDYLMSDFQEYTEAIKASDREKIALLLFPGIADYFKNEFPEEDDKALMETMISNLTVINELAKVVGYVPRYYAGKVQKVVREGEKEIYLLELKIDLENDQEIVENQSTTLGISLDGGNSFTFMTNDDPEVALKILENSFTQSSLSRLESISKYFSNQ